MGELLSASTIGEAIRLLLPRAKWRQHHLAEHAGIPGSTLSTWMRGMHRIPAHGLEAIVSAFAERLGYDRDQLRSEFFEVLERERQEIQARLAELEMDLEGPEE